MTMIAYLVSHFVPDWLTLWYLKFLETLRAYGQSFYPRKDTQQETEQEGEPGGLSEASSPSQAPAGSQGEPYFVTALTLHVTHPLAALPTPTPSPDSRYLAHYEIKTNLSHNPRGSIP